MIRAKSSAQEAKGSGRQEAVEDRVAQERHIKAMKNEYMKVHKNLALGEELMTITFPGRRQEINNEVKKIKDVVERYPFLQNYEEVTPVYMKCNANIHTVKFPRPCSSCESLVE